MCLGGGFLVSLTNIASECLCVFFGPDALSLWSGSVCGDAGASELHFVDELIGISRAAGEQLMMFMRDAHAC